MTLLITKDATSNKVHVFSATADQIKSFNEADMGEAMMGWPVESAAELADTSLTAADLVALHNSGHPGTTLKPAPTQSKRQIAHTVYDGLAKIAMPYDASLLKTRRSTSTVVVKETTPVASAEKPKRLSRAEPWRVDPILPIRPARADSCSAKLIDVLKNGATVPDMKKVVPNWQDSSITSALLTDIRAKNGYGIDKVMGTDGEFVYTLLYPAGMTEPLAHTTKEKK